MYWIQTVLDLLKGIQTSVFTFLLAFELHRWYWHCGDHPGSAGGGRCALMYNGGHLLCLQTRLLLQPKADGEQVRFQTANVTVTSTTSTCRPKTECALCVLVTKSQLKEMGWTMSGRRMRLVDSLAVWPFVFLGTSLLKVYCKKSENAVCYTASVRCLFLWLNDSCINKSDQVQGPDGKWVKKWPKTNFVSVTNSLWKQNSIKFKDWRNEMKILLLGMLSQSFHLKDSPVVGVWGWECWKKQL